MHATRASSILFALLTLSSFTFACLIEGNCVGNDPALRWLSTKLSAQAAIACKGSSLQTYNQGRYWGEQYGKNASVAVFPYTKFDVSHAVRASALTPLGRDLSFVSGAHGMTNASTTSGLIIDMSWLNRTEILHSVTLDDTHVVNAIAYEGGATWESVYKVTNGSGWIPVGARDSSVGVGGFSTGGGIGFLAGAYGYAVDRLRAVEVVTGFGDIVLATKTNQHSDLFWALQGGNGQFGIVTKFWQEAALEPETTELGVWIIANCSIDRAYANTEKWFASNNDPFAVVYYAVGYLPAEVTSGPLGIYTTLVGYRFSNPHDLAQKPFNATFAPLLVGLNLTFDQRLAVPIAQAPTLLAPYFPYGYRRGFWGSQTTHVTAAYIKKMSLRFSKYVTGLLARGESPYSATWVLQYMSPGLNGNLPAADDATAWPHALAGHHTLFSPAWNSSENDHLAYHATHDLNHITYVHQAKFDPPFLADYPNYMSPHASGQRIFGGNVRRLIEVKAKYDPWCRFHQGRTFATQACEIGGWANLYP